MSEEQPQAVEPAEHVSVPGEVSAPPAVPDAPSLDLLLDVPLNVTVELGRTRMSVRQLLALSSGSIVELSKLAGESLDVLVNGKPVARGEAVTVKEKFGVRLTEIVSPSERVESMR